MNLNALLIGNALAGVFVQTHSKPGLAQTAIAVELKQESQKKQEPAILPKAIHG